MKPLPALLKDTISTLIRALFKKPATVLYPKVSVEVPEGFRGQHTIDLKKCVGCGLCARDCPTGAIIMVREPGARGLGVPVINLSKCIFCYQCAESCPKGAIRPTKRFDMASDDPHHLVLDFRPMAYRSGRGRAPSGEQEQG